MIKLKNVSKFYYSKGVIASGFNKINLQFRLGEFVAITGESGSGKSTLLNVISGLDTYEEGEMYINGEETSHYSEKDFEDYRRKYIGNIFQNFNLINSYTVYQNIELVLLLNGENKKEIKEKIINLIKQVGLTKYKNTKVSKLSGGQKQRVAIARALAKDTPVIIADEPTGNLDVKSAQEIIKLLSEIAASKLVIIVTHNYEQVENYVTRKIKMHDGKVLEDKVLKETDKVKLEDDLKYKNISFRNQIKLGVRNAFNIPSKFLLLFLIFAFVTIAVIGEYSGFKKEEISLDAAGTSSNFWKASADRILINKKDKSEITEEDFDKINELSNIKKIIKNDYLIDNSMQISNELDYGAYSYIRNKSEISEVNNGLLTDNELEIIASSYSYSSNIIGHEVTIDGYDAKFNRTTYKVSGLKKPEDYEDYSYVSETVLKEFNSEVNKKVSETLIKIDNKSYVARQYDGFTIIIDNNLKSGEIMIPEEYCYNCLGKNTNISVDNIYYNESLNFKIKSTFNGDYVRKNINKDEYASNYYVIISPEDYYKLYPKTTYQSGVYVSKVINIEETIADLEDLGYNVIAVKDTIYTTDLIAGIKLIKTFVTALLMISLFFITYFVIKLVFKSRNIYYATIRMLGANKSHSRNLLMIELLMISSLAYVVYLILGYLTYIGYINISFTKTIFEYCNIKDCIVLFILLTGMSALISIRYSAKLFKDSSMKTLREEL